MKSALEQSAMGAQCKNHAVLPIAWTENKTNMPKIDYQRLLQDVSIDNVARQLGMDLKHETPTRYKSLCPFHDDKTPSLLIDASRENGRQHFYCFACGAHGDAIDLVKQKLGVGFKEAVAWLNPAAGIQDKGKRLSPARRIDHFPIDNLPGIELAYKLYKRGATNQDLDSWVRQRRLDSSTIRRAGFLFASGNYLSELLSTKQDETRRREEIGLLEDAGLVRRIYPGIRHDYHLPLNSLYTDFFIGPRIIFPIYNEQARLLGLGARAVDATAKLAPKYQLTRGLPKANILYRAESAFKQIRNEVKAGNKHPRIYVCEGFLDALRLESLGMSAVAIMGSSISEPQIQLLRTLSDEFKDAFLTVVVCLDRDEAGLRGAADACLKLLRVPLECEFVWPTTSQLSNSGAISAPKDPDEYLSSLSTEAAALLIANSSYPAELAVLANAFSVSADETLNEETWKAAPRSRRYRAFSKAFRLIKKIGKRGTEGLMSSSTASDTNTVSEIAALREWKDFVRESADEAHPSLSNDFLNDAQARLNHARILAYMGSKRGELPCDEPRWERLDVAATAFNGLLVDRLKSRRAAPIDAYDAVWVPRSFGGMEPRLKMMPKAEDLVIQQYLLNEVLSERWDHHCFAEAFSRKVPAVRYYREEQRTVTTGFDASGNGQYVELGTKTLSFAYQVDMDVLEGRQPATDQGMYRPFIECWRDFMRSLCDQAVSIGYVYCIRLDAKRYYDRLRRYVVRDQLLSRIEEAVASVTGDTEGFAELLKFESDRANAASKAATVMDRIDEQLFGVSYQRPDTGSLAKTEELIGIPQGPVLSAWIGSVSLFPVDEVAHRFMERFNADRDRVGYARYVDDIVILADSPSVLMEMREEIDRCARKLELVLVPKADEIPAMAADEFIKYLNEGRAIAVSGPAWEPPLVGDGEPGWEFWSVTPTTTRQSALQLLHNVELYKATPNFLLQTVRTAFQASDLRATELSKAARLIWYSIACENIQKDQPARPATVWGDYLSIWNQSLQDSAWTMRPEANPWESPILFALEGFERLLDTTSRDVAELSAEENGKRRQAIVWLANLALDEEFLQHPIDYAPAPHHQAKSRLELIRWKALHICGRKKAGVSRIVTERAALFSKWQPFAWLHEAIALLSEATASERDPLLPFVQQVAIQANNERRSDLSAAIISALLPDDGSVQQQANIAPDSPHLSTARGIALQTLASILPKDQLPICLSRRPHLIWNHISEAALSQLILPPLPGVSTSQLFRFIGEFSESNGLITAKNIQIVDFNVSGNEGRSPKFIGQDGHGNGRTIAPLWRTNTIPGAGASLVKLEADLAPQDYLLLPERIQVIDRNIVADDLRKVALLFRAIANISITFSRANDDRELVPAWPYIAIDPRENFYYLIGDCVPRAELGNRAFIRDGGRALRTIEVPIFEAHLWRTGVAVSDYMGLHDDVVKYSESGADVALNAAALANPARYMLRAQLRKLRGAYADSNVSRRLHPTSGLPLSVERSLQLLESFPETEDPTAALLHVLAAESESAAMYLSIRERWDEGDGSRFLGSVAERVLARLPLSVGEHLATNIKESGLRRDLSGILCIARCLFDKATSSPLMDTVAWKGLRGGIVCIGIYTAIGGLIASLRSHGSFERYNNVDFPSDWEIPAKTPDYGAESVDQASTITPGHELGHGSLIDQLRLLIQHLGHRLHRTDRTTDQLSDRSVEQLQRIARVIAEIESVNGEVNDKLEWPFAVVSPQSLELLNLELLESAAMIIKELDAELGIEVITVTESSFGYNAQTRRFTDSKGGVYEVHPWMISQFPRNGSHIEEVSAGGRFLRVWTESFDRKSSRLLSISALSEPFASIAIEKPMHRHTSQQVGDFAGPPILEDLTDNLQGTAIGSHVVDPLEIATPARQEHVRSTEIDATLRSKPSTTRIPPPFEGNFSQFSYDFGRRQLEHWTTRKGQVGQNGHVRIALLQADLELTYAHPFVEVCPKYWPFDTATQTHIAKQLRDSEFYAPLYKATAQPDCGHHWKGLPPGHDGLPSWAEHRRRRILSRVVDSCEAFGVDLLVLPEYSTRSETIEWLKGYIANKGVAVLAGTYMEFRPEAETGLLSAPLKLLWPVPKELTSLLVTSNITLSNEKHESADHIERGLVLEFSRTKKYRSIALEEFFRPPATTIGPLFVPHDIPQKLEQAATISLTQTVLTKLFAGTRLPLKHVLELICSEVFLISNPANYRQMFDDIAAMRKRFGAPTEKEEVFNDVEALSKYLSITGDGINARRSILTVPAATSRSADYWIAGQSTFLAAGTTTVFCNGIDGHSLVGGSCFIGKGSWKSIDGATGYISRVTPYHGWSKGIFYNNKKDALSEIDQAVVIADIDPHNMLEGKPRAQTMPSPLQLVAYLPISEFFSETKTSASLLKEIKIATDQQTPEPQDSGEESFWRLVHSIQTNPNEGNLRKLWSRFSDEKALIARARAFAENGTIQPASGHSSSGILSTPAFYDWIGVSLTLDDHEQLPKIAVPPWGK